MIKRIFVRCGLAAGLLLSVASALDLCPEACSQTHKYVLMGIYVPVLGIIFFTAAAIVYELGRKKEPFSALFTLLIFGASGAEVAFILIQKYRIEKWCPLCLGIAATVYFTAVVISFERAGSLISMFKDRRIMFMSLVRKVIAVIVVFIAGFLVAYKGMRAGEAAENVPNIFLGKQSGPVEVYIMTDWFCPHCRKAEQETEKFVPAVEKKAKIIFVDVPIHQESLNYTPYNLSFLIHEKGKYMDLRKALLNLAAKKKNPTDEDVREAVKPLGVSYKPLSFLDATKGLKFYDSLAKEFQVSGTPTVVIREVKTKKIKKLVGDKEITAQSILNAVEEIGQ